jgi:metal-responsive CopG/Arc/MetJ family transcriptional regulator
MPEDLVAEVDAYAKRRGLTRSAFLARAARQAMHV